MHIQINAELLSKDLKNVAYIVSKFKQESELASVKLQTIDNSLVVTISNDHDKAVITVPCTIQESGECFVVAHKFIGAIQSFIGDVELVCTDKHLTLEQQYIKIKLPLVAHNPLCDVFNRVTFDNTYKICGSILNNMVSIVSPFADVDEKVIISGINMLISGSSFQVRACHNAAMAVSTHHNKDTSNGNANITVKTSTMQAIGKLFADEDIEIKTADSLVCFVGKSCVLYTRTIRGVYPPIEKLIEDESLCKVNMSRQLLETCLRRILVVKTLSKRLNVLISDNIMTVNYDQVLTDKLYIDHTGQETQFAVNYEYLLTVLRVFNGAQIAFAVTPTRKLQFFDDQNIIIISPLC